MAPLVFWNDKSSFRGKAVFLNQSYGSIPEEVTGYLDTGIAPFYADKELKEVAGFVSYTDNVLSTPVLPNGKKILTLNGFYNFNLPTGVINTRGSTVDGTDADGYFLNPVLFDILGGTGVGFNSKGHVILEVVDDKYKWSVFLDA